MLRAKGELQHLLPADLVLRIDWSSSIDELERYAERIITVDTLDEVLAR